MLKTDSVFGKYTKAYTTIQSLKKIETNFVTQVEETILAKLRPMLQSVLKKEYSFKTKSLINGKLINLLNQLWATTRTKAYSSQAYFSSNNYLAEFADPNADDETTVGRVQRSINRLLGISADDEVSDNFFNEYLNQRNAELASKINDDVYMRIQRATVEYIKTSANKGDKPFTAVEENELLEQIKLSLENQIPNKRIAEILRRYGMSDYTDDLDIEWFKTASITELRDEGGDQLVNAKAEYQSLRRELIKGNNITVRERVRRIAVTEMGTAYNLGRMEKFLDDGVEYVSWNLADEHTARGVVCNVCYQRMFGGILNSDVYPIEDILTDPEVQPALHPYCLCYLTPTDWDDPRNKRVKEHLAAGLSADTFFNSLKVGDLKTVAGLAAGLVTAGAAWYAFRKGYVTKFVRQAALDKPSSVLDDGVPTVLPENLVRTERAIKNLEAPRNRKQSANNISSVDDSSNLIPSTRDTVGNEVNIPISFKEKVVQTVATETVSASAENALESLKQIKDDLVKGEEKEKSLKEKVVSAAADEATINLVTDQLNEARRTLEDGVNNLATKYADILSNLQVDATQAERLIKLATVKGKTDLEKTTVFKRLTELQSNAKSNPLAYKEYSDYVTVTYSQVLSDLETTNQLLREANRLLNEYRYRLDNIKKKSRVSPGTINQASKAQSAIRLIDDLTKHHDALEDARRTIITHKSVLNDSPVITETNKKYLTDNRWLKRRVAKLEEFEENFTTPIAVNDQLSKLEDTLSKQLKLNAEMFDQPLTYELYTETNKQLDELNSVLQTYKKKTLSNYSVETQIDQLDNYIYVRDVESGDYFFNPKVVDEIGERKLKQYDDLARRYRGSRDQISIVEKRIDDIRAELEAQKSLTPKIEEKLADTPITKQQADYLLPKQKSTSKKVKNKKYVLSNYQKIVDRLEPMLGKSDDAVEAVYAMRKNKPYRERISSLLVKQNYPQLMELNLILPNGSINWARLAESKYKDELLQPVLDELKTKIELTRRVEFIRYINPFISEFN